jgi:hypothetical protein
MHPVKMQLLAVDDARVDISGSSERADDVDRSARSHRVHRFLERVGAADLDDMVDADAVGTLEDLLVPIRHRLVIDQRVGTEPLATLELGVAARCEENAGPVHLGKGYTEAGHTAGAEDRDGFAGLDTAGLDQRVPRRQRRTGQRRRFLKAQVVGNADRPVLRQHDVLREHPVELAPERILRRVRRNPSTGPGLKERAGDAIADLELRCARTHCHNLTGAVAHRNHWKFRIAVNALDDALVAVVERGCAHADEDLVVHRIRLAAIGIEHEAVESGGFSNFVGSHGNPQSRELARRCASRSDLRPASVRAADCRT